MIHPTRETGCNGRVYLPIFLLHTSSHPPLRQDAGGVAVCQPLRQRGWALLVYLIHQFLEVAFCDFPAVYRTARA